jgi:hypothetical protein
LSLPEECKHPPTLGNSCLVSGEVQHKLIRVFWRTCDMAIPRLMYELDPRYPEHAAIIGTFVPFYSEQDRTSEKGIKFDQEPKLNQIGGEEESVWDHFWFTLILHNLESAKKLALVFLKSLPYRAHYRIVVGTDKGLGNLQLLCGVCEGDQVQKTLDSLASMISEPSTSVSLQVVMHECRKLISPDA